MAETWPGVECDPAEIGCLAAGRLVGCELNLYRSARRPRVTGTKYQADQRGRPGRP
jgi:hypothetical protein